MYAGKRPNSRSFRFHCCTGASCAGTKPPPQSPPARQAGVHRMAWKLLSVNELCEGLRERRSHTCQTAQLRSCCCTSEQANTLAFVVGVYFLCPFFNLIIPRSLNELRVLLLESHRHSRDVEKDLNREVHKAEWKVKEQKLQDDIKTLREKLLLLVRTHYQQSLPKYPGNISGWSHGT